MKTHDTCIDLLNIVNWEDNCRKFLMAHKFTGKYLCQSLFFNALACTFIKKETLAQMFSCKFLRTPFVAIPLNNRSLTHTL